MTRVAQIGLVILVAMASLLLVGCADDLYGECTISSGDGGELDQCLDTSQSVSCVVTGQLECSTGVCGKYQGSNPFCTTPCQDDGDCPSGQCRQFVLRVEGTSHCVADQFL